MDQREQQEIARSYARIAADASIRLELLVARGWIVWDQAEGKIDVTEECGQRIRTGRLSRFQTWATFVHRNLNSSESMFDRSEYDRCLQQLRLEPPRTVR